MTTTATLGIRRSNERGDANHGWLQSRHTFSFADYVDPKWKGYRGLRVINEDRVEAGAGFPKHGHRDMEIVSYVLEGALEHEDSTGTRAVIRPGEVQRMTAGRGVTHSEYNASKEDPVHFLQIWIIPNRPSLEPGYEQKSFPAEEKKGALRVVASPDGRDGSVLLHADATISATILDAGDVVEFEVPEGRHAWIHVAKGAVKVGGHALEAGDAAFTERAGTVTLDGTEHADVLVFDLG